MEATGTSETSMNLS